jgi:hypothetical protein
MPSNAQHAGIETWVHRCSCGNLRKCRVYCSETVCAKPCASPKRWNHWEFTHLLYVVVVRVDRRHLRYTVDEWYVQVDGLQRRNYTLSQQLHEAQRDREQAAQEFITTLSETTAKLQVPSPRCSVRQNILHHTKMPLVAPASRCGVL